MPYFASPVVLAGMSRAGTDLPMTLYWPRGLSGTFLKSSGYENFRSIFVFCRTSP